MQTKIALGKILGKIWKPKDCLSEERADSSLVDHALAEFKAAGWIDESDKYCDEMQKLICGQVIELLELFSNHGHSGSSASYAIGLFEKLAKYEPIVPLTGEESEWNKIGEGFFQNKRCGRVFKQANRFDGQAYDTEAVVFWEWWTDQETGEQRKSYFTAAGSFQPVEFPYTPTREYREYQGD